ncbi:MAG TPA: ATP-binding protein [Sphingomonas sp.]|jgi:signal transduction histidine kinase|uniref:sensor histidine kinase n=1 Tax=Sphingomonas sp. TaxID=28214 RepID=UPI002EDB5BFE
MRLRGLLRSSTFGFVVLVFLLQLVSAAMILLTVQQMTAGEALRESRGRAAALGTAMRVAYARGGRAGLAAAISARLAADPGTDAVMLLTDAGGRALAGNLGMLPPALTARAGPQIVELYRTGGDRPERMVATARALADGSRLVTGDVIEDDLALTAIVEDAMVGAALLAIPLALLGAVVAARVVDRRVGRIAETVHAVAAGDLTQRVPLAGAEDAFEALAQGVNAMLDRIEALVGELRLVTDGLAHDLRSPLTRLRATLDRAVAATRDPVALGALDTVAIEAETLLRMLTTALEISRAEAGIGRDARADTDVAALIEDLAELYGPLAEEQGQRLEIAVEPMLHHPLHRELIGQALANLVDNALKYGASGGVVTLSAAATPAGGLMLSIADAGTGIAPADRQEALRRFGRLDPARHLGGAGLGLSLVAAVARLHEGTMRLEDNAPGLRVVLVLG